MLWCLHNGKTVTKTREGEKEKEIETKRLADPLLAILDRSAVAMATSSPQLVFGAASGITAEDLMFGTHLGSANMALQSVTPLLAPHHALNPLFRTQRLAPDPPAFKFSPLSARLTDRSPDPDRCFGCSVQWIHGCARSMCCANFDGIHYWLCKKKIFYQLFTAAVFKVRLYLSENEEQK